MYTPPGDAVDQLTGDAAEDSLPIIPKREVLSEPDAAEPLISDAVEAGPPMIPKAEVKQNRSNRPLR